MPIFNAIGANAERYWINGIVRDGKRINLQLADRNALAGLKRFELLAVEFAPGDRRSGESAEIDRNIQLAQDGYQAADVIAVFVGDDHGVEIFGRLADCCQARKNLPLAQPRIDKDASVLRPDECGIARAAARQHTDF